MTLEDFFKTNRRAALAFSGGVDSAYLLHAALTLGCDLRAYYVRTEFQPRFELEDARRLAAGEGIPLREISLSVLAEPQIRENGPERCYHCKRRLLSAVAERALAEGCTLLLDGTNASDAADDRPGMRALAELSFRSPLRECGLTKDEIRRRSREAGLFTWDKPAYACLATRISTGTAITADALETTEAAEAALRGLGFRDFRVRMAGRTAKLQVAAAELPRVLAERETILAALRPGYDRVTLDLEVRP